MGAIEKFKTYAAEFKEFAVSIPQTVNTSTRSTAVILWGLMRPQNDTTENDDDRNYVWRNINLQMIFQGVARSIVNIEHFNSNFPIPWLNDKPHIELIEKQIHATVKHDGANGHKKSRKNVSHEWLPAPPCRSKEITGMKVVKVHSLIIDQSSVNAASLTSRHTSVHR